MFRAGTGIVFVVVLGLTIAMTMNGQVKRQSLSVTVETAKSKSTLTAAHILFMSSKGYILGAEYQDFGGIYVTEPVVPPEGFNLKTTLIRWEALRLVEFTDWNVKEGQHRFVKATLTLTNGSARDVFVWVPAQGTDSFRSLTAGDAKITGKLAVQGTEQDVTTAPGADLKSLEFEISK